MWQFLAEFFTRFPSNGCCFAFYGQKRFAGMVAGVGQKATRVMHYQVHHSR
jgi:hypothetical protein